jgi:hypothetical protein
VLGQKWSPCKYTYKIECFAGHNYFTLSEHIIKWYLTGSCVMMFSEKSKRTKGRTLLSVHSLLWSFHYSNPPSTSFKLSPMEPCGSPQLWHHWRHSQRLKVISWQMCQTYIPNWFNAGNNFYQNIFTESDGGMLSRRLGVIRARSTESSNQFRKTIQKRQISRIIFLSS